MEPDGAAEAAPDGSAPPRPTPPPPSATTLTDGAPRGTLPLRFRRSTVTGYLGTAGSILVALVATPVLARTLGPTRFGIWSVVGASVTYLEVLELGFGGATISFVADAAAHREPRLIRRVVATSFWTLVLPGVAAMLLAGVVATWGPGLLDLHGGDATAMQLLTLMLGLDLAFSIPSDTFGGTIAGLGRMDLVNITNLVIVLLQAIGWVVVLTSGGRLVALGIVTASLGLAGQVWRYTIARRLVPGGLSLRPQGVQRDLLRPMGALSAWFALSDVNKVVVQRLDVILVGLVVDVQAAAIYAIAQKLAVTSLRAVDPATISLFPHAADLRARGDTEGLTRLLDAGARIAVGITAPVAVCIGFFAKPLLELWVGRRYANGASVVVLLTSAMIVVALGTVVQHVLKGMRAARAAGLGAALDASVNLSLSIALGLAFGTWGVAAATLAGGAAALVLVLLPAACRALATPFPAFLGRLARAHVPAAVVACGVAALLRGADPNPGWRVLLEVVGVGVVHVVLLTRTALDDGERERLADRLRALSRRPRRAAA